MNIIRRMFLLSTCATAVVLAAGCDTAPPDIDLYAVLDVTADTLVAYSDELDQLDDSSLEPDAAFLGFSERLEEAYNAATPALHSTRVGVLPQNDASLYVYEDVNGNGEAEQSEDALWLIEIDGERSRIIATSR
ncbi:MAG: hypothetical protein AAFX85_04395, partial [Pseudomonadota bacterium]